MQKKFTWEQPLAPIKTSKHMEPDMNKMTPMLSPTPDRTPPDVKKLREGVKRLQEKFNQGAKK